MQPIVAAYAIAPKCMSHSIFPLDGRSDPETVAGQCSPCSRGFPYMTAPLRTMAVAGGRGGVRSATGKWPAQCRCGIGRATNFSEGRSVACPGVPEAASPSRMESGPRGIGGPVLACRPVTQGGGAGRYRRRIGLRRWGRSRGAVAYMPRRPPRRPRLPGAGPASPGRRRELWRSTARGVPGPR